MKNLRIILSTLLVLASTVVGAQNLKKKGKLDATTTKVFNFERNGTQIPYKVTIQESRIYNIKFDENDKGKLNADRKDTPAKVSKLIIVNSDIDDVYDRLIVLKYDKQITDTFKLISTNRGFAVKVDDKTVEYIMGEGLYYANTEDMDFFVVDEFDYIK